MLLELIYSNGTTRFVNVVDVLVEQNHICVLYSDVSEDTSAYDFKDFDLIKIHYQSNGWVVFSKEEQNEF